MITLYQDCLICETGRDGYGKPIKKNVRSEKCRVVEKVQLVKNQANIETVSQLEVILSASAIVDVDDKIEFTGSEFGDKRFKDKEFTIISLKITRNTLGEVVKKVIYI